VRTCTFKNLNMPCYRMMGHTVYRNLLQILKNEAADESKATVKKIDWKLSHFCILILQYVSEAGIANCFTDVVWTGQALAASLHENKTLKSLNIESNYISGQAIVNIMSAVNVHQVMTEFRVSNQVGYVYIVWHGGSTLASWVKSRRNSRSPFRALVFPLLHGGVQRTVERLSLCWHVSKTTWLNFRGGLHQPHLNRHLANGHLTLICH